MPDKNHILKKLVFDIRTTDQDMAHTYVERIKSAFEHKAKGIIKKILNEFSLENNIIRIDKLEIDLGSWDGKQVNDSLLQKMEDGLVKAIKSAIQNEAIAKEMPGFNPGQSAAKSKQISIQHSQESLLEFYLKNGVLPWNESASSFSAPEKLREIIFSFPEQAVNIFWKISHDPNSIRRLCQQLSESAWKELLNQLQPGFHPYLKEIVSFFQGIEAAKSSSRFSPSAIEREIKVLTLVVIAELKQKRGETTAPIAESELEQNITSALALFYEEKNANPKKFVEKLSHEIVKWLGQGGIKVSNPKILSLIRAQLKHTEGRNDSAIDQIGNKLTEAILNMVSNPTRKTNGKLSASQVAESIMKSCALLFPEMNQSEIRKSIQNQLDSMPESELHRFLKEVTVLLQTLGASPVNAQFSVTRFEREIKNIALAIQSEIIKRSEVSNSLLHESELKRKGEVTTTELQESELEKMIVATLRHFPERKNPDRESFIQQFSKDILKWISKGGVKLDHAKIQSLIRSEMAHADFKSMSAVELAGKKLVASILSLVSNPTKDKNTTINTGLIVEVILESCLSLFPDMKHDEIRKMILEQMDLLPAGLKYAEVVNELKAKMTQLSGHRKSRVSKRPAFKPMNFQEEEIYIDNAGIVLINPYLPMFFQALGLTEDDKLVNDDAASFGVALLHYLSTGSTTFLEQELVLHKILCGLDPAFPMDVSIPLTDNQLAEANALLDAVISHWEILGSPTHDQFRELFLRREGRLKDKSGSWDLKVNRQTLDIVLDKLPWAFSIVKLPWMERFLYVDW